ncbi:MAG: DNA mismatch repair protein MutS [Tannerellaceae bacterium]|jgi:hypothetical protein|nr:DNA mismatch repair protein MutS [Tannerellaceae bacterium]
MENVYRYYNRTIDACSQRAKDLQKKIHRMGTARLALVVGAVAAVWFLRERDWQEIAGVVSLFAVAFAVLMVLHTLLSHKKSYTEALRELCANELKGLHYDFSAFDGAAGKIAGAPSFCSDLDIFGPHSFFQSVNRTVTAIGHERLAAWFMEPLTDKDAIVQRQEAVKELAPLAGLRQDFYVNGILRAERPAEDTRLLSHLMNTSTVFARSRFRKVAVRTVPVLWMAVFVCFIGGYMPLPLFSLLFILSALVAYIRIRQINRLHRTVDTLEKILVACSRLMKCIEDRDFTSGILSGIRRQLHGKEGTASRAIKKLSSHIGVLDQRMTLTGILLNIFTFRDIQACISIEQWKSAHGTEAADWFDALACFDALSSLAGFAFNHPDYIYPILSDTYFRMSGKALGHPLIRRDVCVKNPVAIETSPQFLIITGANMAGKSTYLRTVGINFLLATIGAPVYAGELSLCPATMVTSLRTSDSLTDSESYFFAELKRLKMIIDRLKQGEKLFIILDEILKGTNSADKQKGSIALMKQLISYKACGIIATHDLALGLLEQKFPGQAKNFRFEADITGDALTFSYQLKEGIAQNMNACFLMQKMGITVD